MELIDVLDDEGAPTGRVKPKPDVHRDGDWHRSVHVWFVTPAGRLLLQKRSVNKENHPGLWDVSAAGHVSSGESAVESAVREIEEEIGLVAGPEDLRHLATLRESHVLNGGRYIDNEIHEVYVVRREIDLGSLHLQESEVDDVALVSIDELHTFALVPHAEEYALLEGMLRPGAQKA